LKPHQVLSFLFLAGVLGTASGQAARSFESVCSRSSASGGFWNGGFPCGMAGNVRPEDLSLSRA
jgi:hypothetical protein